MKYGVFAYCDSCSLHYPKEYEPIRLGKNDVEIKDIPKIIRTEARPYLEKSHGHSCKRCGNVTWQIRILFPK